MEKIRKIIKCVYKGEVDKQGLPHGTGKILYVVEPDPEKEIKRPYDEGLGNLCYEGTFEHGVRQGDGDLHSLGLGYNPVSRYEWFSEGEYDGCGRLIHPTHEEGSYQEYVQVWYPYFEGTWQDDMPLKARWYDEDPMQKISKAGLAYIRLTSHEAVKNLPFEQIENS